MIQATLAATLVIPPSTGGDEIVALPDSVELLEVRSDLVDIGPEWLRSHFSGRLLYALRSRAQGGAFEGSVFERHDKLKYAARCYDLIELESPYDFAPDVLSEIPIEKRVVSWHGSAEDVSTLNAKFGELTSVPASLYKLVTIAATHNEELLPLSLLKSLNRTDTIAYATGPHGFWTRLIAPRLGAPIVFGRLPGGPEVPEEPTITKLIEDYGLPQIAPLEGLYGIVGNPVFHSLSPRLHNAAYLAMDYPGVFVPFHVESLSDFWHEIVEGEVLESLNLPLKGLTVVSPYKEAALRLAKSASPIARRAESANILVRDNGLWNADTTDSQVVLMAESNRGLQMNHKRAAVIGGGGAGRAIAVALDDLGATVTLINQGVERGDFATKLLGLPCIPFQGFSARGYDVVVNATPVGRDDGKVPFAVETLDKDAVVIDLVYGLEPTPLVRDAKALGHTVIDGREVLLTQVHRQIHLMTSREIPTNMLSEKLNLEIKHSDLAGCCS